MDQSEVSALVDEVAAAWNSHDIRRYAACFAPDADVVNVAGMWWRGRSEIEQNTQRLHSGPFKHTVLTLTLGGFKAVAPGVGVAHVDTLLEGHEASGPRRTTEPRHGIMTWTVREHGGRLEIVAGQNTDTLAAPPPPRAVS
jgi:uncharacterized protein (TIGR02246 family)